MTGNLRRVFLSSTFEDLSEYRQAVIAALENMGLEPVLLESIRPGQIVTEVKSEIRKSDIVILIIGHRYGTVSSETGKSFVEIEYEQAKELGKPTLVFLAREDIPWPPDAIDIDRSQILGLRNRIIQGLSYRKFSSPQELSTKIVESLSRIIDRSKTEEKAKPESAIKVRKVRIIRMLLSSPGDVQEERGRASSAVFRFNQEAVEDKGFFIKLVRWEDMAPQIGPGPQNVINTQIGRYDLFVGIMWNRFGTPTDVAASGTKEEFDAAVGLWKKERKPWITFYFCDRPVNFTTPEQLEQKKMVLGFRFELNDMGVVRTFNLADEFEDRFYRDLVKITSLPEFNEIIK